MLDVEHTEWLPRAYLEQIGTVFATWGPRPDWGNVSYGVRVGRERYFVKTAGHADDSSHMPWAQRVELLHNAVRVAHSCRHRGLPRLYGTIESPGGPMLIYEWVDGDVPWGMRAERDDPRSAFYRFCHLPVPDLLRALDVVYDVHDALAREGWIAVDFYGRSLLYDWTRERMYVVDLDMYRPGPFRNEMGRMYGSSRFMAPEEFEMGALIDQRSNVFTMGRAAFLLLGDGSLARSAFRGSDALYAVAYRACREERDARYESMAAFYAAWKEAAICL
jgi:serine/threonine-protein kinase